MSAGEPNPTQPRPPSKRPMIIFFVVLVVVLAIVYVVSQAPFAFPHLG